jgi:DNA primase
MDLTKFDIESYLDAKKIVYDPQSILSYKERRYHCPFCGDKDFNKYHCYVNLEDTQFHCHWCSRSGNAITFIRFLDKGKNWVEVLKRFDISSIKQYTQNEFNEHLGLLPEFFELITCEPLPSYLANKRFSLEHIKPYGVGKCKFGNLKDRVVFPIYLNGELISYIAKTDIPDVPRSYTLCKTSNLLYNYDIAKRFRTLVIVESVTDVIAVGSHSVALFGKHLSNLQLNLIIQGRFDKIIVCLDADAHLYTLNVAKKLSPFADVYVVLLNRGDPCDRINDIHTVLEKSVIRYSEQLLHNIKQLYP